MKEEIEQRDREHSKIEIHWTQQYNDLQEKFEKAHHDSMMF
jgi:hypothetical protein